MRFNRNELKYRYLAHRLQDKLKSNGISVTFTIAMDWVENCTMLGPRFLSQYDPNKMLPKRATLIQITWAVCNPEIASSKLWKALE